MWIIDILSNELSVQLVYQYFKEEVSCNCGITFSLNPNRGDFYIGVSFFSTLLKYNFCEWLISWYYIVIYFGLFIFDIMLFNSIEFLLFLPTVFVLYWFVFNKNLKHQNLLILFSSYVFYGWWDYRFLSLIFLSTIVDYIIGLNIPKQDSEKKQKLLLWCSVLFNLSVLGFFKYYNFFVDSWIDLFSSVGYEIKSVWTLNIILPVGISFYTFQTMSYTIDVYKKKLDPTLHVYIFG